MSINFASVSVDNNVKTAHLCAYLQACQTTPDGAYNNRIAASGTEEMWIDNDGQPYLYYTGPDRE